MFCNFWNACDWSVVAFEILATESKVPDEIALHYSLIYIEKNNGISAMKATNQGIDLHTDFKSHFTLIKYILLLQLRQKKGNLEKHLSIFSLSCVYAKMFQECIVSNNWMLCSV